MVNSNNPPDVILNLTSAQADFLLRNCEQNIGYGLNILQKVHDGLPMDKQGVDTLVNGVDGFKGIKDLLDKAMNNG